MAAYDVIVIGGGPGGYMAAEKAGGAGLKTLSIEDKHYGGTCLNEGCIPTKTLLNSGKAYLHAKEGEAFGVIASDVKLDHSKVIDRKENVIKTLVNGVKAGVKASKCEMADGFGRLAGRNSEGYVVKVGDKEYTGKNIIIASGSHCFIPPFIKGIQEGIDAGFVMTNVEALECRELPKKLAVLGGGIIGLEMATYFAMAGVEVTVLEMLDHVGGPNDVECTKILQKNLEKFGMKFMLGAKVTAVNKDSVSYELGGRTEEIKADKVLLSIGRKANVAGLGLEEMGIVTERGAIVTDEHMQTNLPNIYAVGDCNGKLMLAHTAYREADVAVNNILGKRDRMRYDAIPSVLYTVPELSMVGKMEEQCRKEGLDVKVVKLPMVYSGRYIAENTVTDGIAKMVFDKKYGTLLGATFLCNYSSEFISAAAICVEMGLTASDIKKMVFPHPTVAEIMREAVDKF